MKRISELGTTLVVTSKLADSFHPDNGADMFIQNVRFYKSHMASHPRKLHSASSDPPGL
jgi:hypothetical protein